MILLLQAGLMLLDPTPRYLMGDSASYLWAVAHGGPSDRSWTYPVWFLGPLLSLHSLNFVVYAQCALGVVPAWLAFGLVSGPGGRKWDVIAFLTACVCLVEPLALTYQRFVLADSLGLVTAATAVFLCVRIIDRSPKGAAYAALAPIFMVLAASLRPSQVPSLALLAAITLILLFFFHRDYRTGLILLASIILCQVVFSHYALQRQGTPGYNAASGRFMLAAVLPIVSRDDVQPYIDPEKTPAVLDDLARGRRTRPHELFHSGFAADQIHQASRDLKAESRLSGSIAIHAILRDPIAFLALAWSTYLDYFDQPYVHSRVLDEAGMRGFEPNELAYLAQYQIYDAGNTAAIQSPIRSYFEAAQSYYGLIPAFAAILLAASFVVDRRPSTMTLAAFGLASAASHIAFSTEPVPRYLIVSAWANIVVAGRIASVLATRFSRSTPVRPLSIRPQGIRPWEIIVATGLITNILLILIPGYYSHDELNWQNRIARDDDPWSFGLGDFIYSPFFRPLGAIFTSLSLRLPLQPLGAHLTEVLFSIATACLLYHAVALFRPERALAAAILFMLMPGFAFGAGWVAAGFDIQFTFWGVVCILCAVLYWRGGHALYSAGSLAAFAAALACKETALSIPLCAALLLYVDRDKVVRRRAAILAAAAGLLIAVYLGLGATRILRMSASGAGGYRLGSGLQVLNNILAYFGFPFAPDIAEIQPLPLSNARQALTQIVPHLLLIALILWRAGPKWALIYMIAFYATLLPVLPISKFETQYTYAGSIVLAVALALVWERRWLVAVPVAALTLVLIAHGLTIQEKMYSTGVCQTRALATLKAVLNEARPDTPRAVLIRDDTPWWVMARAVHENSFPLSGEFATVSVTRDPDRAGMVFGADCSVSVR